VIIRHELTLSIQSDGIFGRAVSVDTKIKTAVSDVSSDGIYVRIPQILNDVSSRDVLVLPNIILERGVLAYLEIIERSALATNVSFLEIQEIEKTLDLTWLAVVTNCT
jgi:hypothetical protein